MWRQAQESTPLNAAFSHDLRNPVTVLKGTVKLLRQGTADGQALERMETYVLRIERYVEAMSGIQRLEQMPVQKKEVKQALLRDEVEETVRLLAPKKTADVEDFEAASVFMKESVLLDHSLFLTVAENLIGNAARYARGRISVKLSVCEGALLYDRAKDGSSLQQTCTMQGEDFLTMIVQDDGRGYPSRLLQEGPKPFGKMEEDAAHFGMGLYTSRILCQKHGGELFLENVKGGGARAIAIFQI